MSDCRVPMVKYDSGDIVSSNQLAQRKPRVDDIPHINFGDYVLKPLALDTLFEYETGTYPHFAIEFVMLPKLEVSE